MNGLKDRGRAAQTFSATLANQPDKGDAQGLHRYVTIIVIIIIVTRWPSLVRPISLGPDRTSLVFRW